MSDLDAARSGSQRIRCSAVVVVSEARYRQCLCNFSCFFFFIHTPISCVLARARLPNIFRARLTAGFSVPLLVVLQTVQRFPNGFRVGQTAGPGQWSVSQCESVSVSAAACGKIREGRSSAAVTDK